MVVLTPTIRIPGFLGVKLEELFVFGWFCLFLLFYKSKQIDSFILTIRTLFLIFFAVIIAISIAVGSIHQLPTSLMDYSKYIWWIKIVLIYFILTNFIFYDEKTVIVNRDALLSHFITAGVLSSFICFQQYFDLFSLNSIYVPFIAPTQAFTLMPGYSSPRVIGMIGNPNAQGFFLAACIICTFYLFLEKKLKYKLIVPLILFIALLMTLSRTALIVCFAGLIALTLMYKKNFLFAVYKLVLASFITTLLTAAYIFLKDNEVIYKLIIFRLETLGNGLEDGSFQARFHAWKINIEYFLKSPIFGVGPLPRADIFKSADNEWLLLLRTYGFLGTTWFFLLSIIPILLYKPNNIYQKNVKAFSLTVCFIVFLYMIPAGAFTSTSLAPVVLFLYALLDKTHFRIIKNENK